MSWVFLSVERGRRVVGRSPQRSSRPTTIHLRGCTRAARCLFSSLSLAERSRGERRRVHGLSQVGFEIAMSWVFLGVAFSGGRTQRSSRPTTADLCVCTSHASSAPRNFFTSPELVERHFSVPSAPIPESRRSVLYKYSNVTSHRANIRLDNVRRHAAAAAVARYAAPMSCAKLVRGSVVMPQMTTKGTKP